MAIQTYIPGNSRFSVPYSEKNKYGGLNIFPQDHDGIERWAYQQGMQMLKDPFMRTAILNIPKSIGVKLEKKSKEKTKALQRNEYREAKRIDQDMRVLMDKLITAQSLVHTVRHAVPQQYTSTKPQDRLGFLPLVPVIGAAAIGGVTALGMKGLSLIKEFSAEQEVVDKVESGLLTSEEAKKIIESLKTPTLESGIAKGVQSGIASGLMWGGIIVISFLAYKFFEKG